MTLPSLPTVSLYGVAVSKLGLRDTADYLAEAIRERKPHFVITANPIMLMAALEDPGYHAMMARADLVVPDGTGVVWAANRIGRPVAEKVAGIELMEELIRRSETTGWRSYLLGASEDNIQAAAAKLRAKYPKANIVGVRNGYFGPDDDEAVIREIVEAKPDLLFVGRQSDNQEPWIDKFKHKLGIPVMMGVGGSFDIFSGKIKRAPKLFIRLRLEWLHRLLLEPRRYKRMLVLPKFAIKVIRDGEKVGKS